MKKSFWRVGLLVVAAIVVAGAGPLDASAAANRGNARRPYGVITGTVLDASGQPLAGALVKVLRDGAGQIVSESKSAADGSFIARVAPGRYLLRALAEGFNPATFTAVEIGPSTELVYRFNLQPAGEGRTTAERRPDRDDPKFKLRSQHARRSIFHGVEGEDETVEAAVAAIEEAEGEETAAALDEEGFAVGDGNDDERARAHAHAGLRRDLLRLFRQPARGQLRGGQLRARRAGQPRVRSDLRGSARRVRAPRSDRALPRRTRATA